jgi:iron complex outermembrane receptor protein
MIRSFCFVVCTLSAVGSAAAGSIASNDLDLIDGDAQVVLTPTRLRQSLAEVPGSVTVITADMIQKFGITSLPDALRLVPGMVVDQADGNTFAISYHATTPYSPRRMNVLVDGVSVYLPLLAGVDWQQLPVAVEDILRIEVTRGPNSAAYGPNSMMAIVNIITKQPKDVLGTTLVNTTGTFGTNRGTIRYAGKFSEASAYRLTFDFLRSSGIGSAYYLNPDHDGVRIGKLNFRSITDIASNETLDVQASAIRTYKEWGLLPPYQATYPDVRVEEYFLSGLWRKNFSANHEIQVHAYASQHAYQDDSRSCPLTYALLPEMYALWKANKNYVYMIFAGQAPTGGTPQDDALAAAAINAYLNLGSRALQPTCVTINQDLVESRKDIEIQDTSVFSETLRMVSGFGLRQDAGTSRTLLQGSVRNNSAHVFGNIEYKPAAWLNLNAGGYLEKDQLTGFSFSPRVAANLHASDAHSFRFVLSKGTRSPDIYEQRGKVAYYLTDFSTPVNGATEGYYFLSSQASGNLHHEHVFSKEIGYHGNFPQYGLTVDAKLFNDQLTNLISETFTVYDFSLTNNNSARQHGLDLQINYEPSDRWATYFAYSYLDSDASTPMEAWQYSRNTGTLGITHLFDNGLRASFSVYGAHDLMGAGLSQGFAARQELTLSKTFALERQSRLTAAFTIRHQGGSDRYAPDIGAIRDIRYDVGMQYYFTVKLDL